MPKLSRTVVVWALAKGYNPTFAIGGVGGRLAVGIYAHALGQPSCWHAGGCVPTSLQIGVAVCPAERGQGGAAQRRGTRAAQGTPPRRSREEAPRSGLHSQHLLPHQNS